MIVTIAGDFLEQWIKSSSRFMFGRFNIVRLVDCVCAFAIEKHRKMKNKNTYTMQWNGNEEDEKAIRIGRREKNLSLE